MSNVTSTLDIVLKDDVSRSAATIAASLQKMEAEAKAVDAALGKSGTGDKFQANLKKIGAGAVHVEAVTKAWQDYSKAQGLAANHGDWSAKQTAQVKAWESASLSGIRAVMSAEKQLQAQQHARAEAQRRDMERLAHRQDHQATHHGFGNYVAQSALMAVSAHGIMSAVEGAVEKGAEYQHKLVALQNTGRTPAELEEMNRASHAALRGVPTATLTGNLEILNETVGAFGSVEHAMEHLGFMAKSSAVLHAVAGDKISESAGAMGNQLARFFEMRGTAGNGHVFEHEASEMMKGMIFSGGNVNPRELLNFATQAKSALQNYDLHFLSRVVPSLVGEMGGDKTGTQAAAFANVILGKARDAKQTEAWLKYGLLDPKQTIKGSKGPTGWTGGAVYNTDLALRDPLAFGEEFLLKKLAAGGVKIDDQLELTKVLGTLFRNGMSNAFANELWQRQNRTRLHKDDHYIGEVEDQDTIYKRLLKTDPTFAFKALKDSIGNLLTTTTSPLMGMAAANMSGLAENLNQIAVAADNHPMAAATAGIVTAAGALYGAGRASMAVMNGFGSSIAKGIATEIAGSGVGGAVSKAIVGEVTGLVEGGLTVGALEVAATGAVTLTAGTVGLLGLTAVGLIAALRASMDPKKQAASDPDFGNPFAPGKGFDFNDPKFRSPEDRTDAEKNAEKWWFNRTGPSAHPRGGGQSQRDTDLPGHWENGRAGTAPHWVVHDLRPLKNAPYFSTAPLGADGRPLGSMPSGWFTGRGPVDPTTGSRIGWGNLPTDPALYEPADVPLPAPRPASQLASRTFGNYLKYTRPLAAAGEMGDATPAQNVPDITPNVDSSGVDALKMKASDAHAALDGLNTTATPVVNTATLDDALSKLRQIHALLGGMSGTVNVGVNQTGGTSQVSLSPRRSMAPQIVSHTTA